MDQPKAISVHQLAERHGKQNLDVVDVRTPLEFGEVRAFPARNVPLDRLDPHAVIGNRIGTAEEPLYVICKSGARGAKACRLFLDAGYTNVINVEGGTEAWVAAGLPVVRGKKVMSLERQVRIAAGSIVLLGAVAAMVTGNIYFAGIPAFVGAGLMIAGITDSCAMGMMLAKMPWNRRKDITCSV
jgi:rhodanese-related sulfurtransferase